jgi:hypothetical protein
MTYRVGSRQEEQAAKGGAGRKKRRIKPSIIKALD